MVVSTNHHVSGGTSYFSEQPLPELPCTRYQRSTRSSSYHSEAGCSVPISPAQSEGMNRHIVPDSLPLLIRIRRKRLGTRLAILRSVETARRFMDATCMMKFNLNVVAREAMMSKYAFIRNFRQVFNETPHQYYVRRRIEYARVLLGKGNSVKETAQACGYPDIFSFSKQFKEMTGIAPSRFFTQSKNSTHGSTHTSTYSQDSPMML